MCVHECVYTCRIGMRLCPYLNSFPTISFQSGDVADGVVTLSDLYGQGRVGYREGRQVP